MWGTILSLVAGLAGKLLSSLFGKKDPTPVDLATSNATAQTELTQQETANAVQTQASAARTAADVAVVRAIAPSGADATANAALKQQFGDEFRD